MPQINLLSTATPKKVQRLRTSAMPSWDFSAISLTALPSIVFLTAILLIVAIIISFTVEYKKRSLAVLNEKIATLAINPTDLLKIQSHKSALDKKIITLDDLSRHKFLWSDKLVEIGECLPKGVWLNEMVLNSKKTYGVAPGEEEEKEQVILSVRGSAIAPQIDNAVSFIGEFVNALKQKTSFSRDFSDIKLNAIYKGSVGKSDVMNFELVCLSK